MATLDLGKIKQVWRGTWSSSPNPAYSVDDLVEYTDGGITSTYIAVSTPGSQVPSSSGSVQSNWNIVAKGVADPIPTQSGQSGKFLKTDGSSLSFDDAGGGKLLKYHYWEATNEFSTNSTSYVDVTNASYDFTPSAAGSKIWILFTPMIAAEDQVQSADGFMAIRSGSTTLFETKHWNYTYSGNTWRTSYTFNHPIQYIDTPTYTLGNSINYKLSLKKGGSEMRMNYNGQGKSNFLIWEIGA